jgi:hypothetical protein
MVGRSRCWHPVEPHFTSLSPWLLRVGWRRSPHGLLSITEVPPAGRR